MLYTKQTNAFLSLIDAIDCPDANVVSDNRIPAMTNDTK